MNVMKVSKLYFSNSEQPQKNKRGKRSEPASVLLHQTGSCDLTIACVTLLKIIVHSQPVNPPDAAQTHDVAVAVPATAKEASVPASTSTPPVQREQSVHLILLIFHLLYSCFSF
jgi:hypothetical protein